MSLTINIKSKLESFDVDISLKTSTNRIGILGASGAGKSMLLKYISGIISPDEGVIVLNGETIFDSNQKINIIPQNRNVAYMFQSYALFPNMTVRDNIEIIINGSKDYIKSKANKLMEKFCINNLANKLPYELSGGQQQRVALARIMAYEPKVILLDEPFSALDNDLKDKLQIELEEMLADYEGIVIMVSHSRDEIYRFSDELIIVDNGKVVEHGLTKDIFSSPRTVQGAKMIGISNILPAFVEDDSVICIPEFNLNINESNTDSKLINKIKHIGIRDVDFKILAPDENSEIFFGAKIVKIYEGIDYTKVFFTVKKYENNHFFDSENQEKVYCIRVNKSYNNELLKENSTFRLAIDKEKLIYIHD